MGHFCSSVAGYILGLLSSNVIVNAAIQIITRWELKYLDMSEKYCYKMASSLMFCLGVIDIHQKIKKIDQCQLESFHITDIMYGPWSKTFKLYKTKLLFYSNCITIEVADS